MKNPAGWRGFGVLAGANLEESCGAQSDDDRCQAKKEKKVFLAYGGAINRTNSVKLAGHAHDSESYYGYAYAHQVDRLTCTHAISLGTGWGNYSL